MGKLDVNKKLKRDALLNTAFQLFTQNGINKTSISDIVDKAGLAKGTFYLYFKDKFDIRNKLVSHKSSELFSNAVKELHRNKEELPLEDSLIFIVDSIINQLYENQALLGFISKNLSWGIFKTALTTPVVEGDINFHDVYIQLLEKAPYKFDEPEIMLFMIVELVSSTCYSSILYNEPVNLEKLKPYLYRTIRGIMDSHLIKS